MFQLIDINFYINLYHKNIVGPIKRYVYITW